jgi:Flp pilus assembly protein TadD
MTPEAERLLESGQQAETEGNVRDALVSYEAAVELAATEALPRLRLGTVCHRLRDYARAREVLEEAGRLDPENADVAFRLGVTCDALGDREQARVAYSRTMMLAPSSWQTWFLIGRDHRQLGHTEVARLAFLRALDASPDEAEVLAELGTLLWEMGMRDDAFLFLERAALNCPVDPGFSLQLGLAQMERGELAAAQRHVMGAKHLDPSDRRIDVALQDLAVRRTAARKGKHAA